MHQALVIKQLLSRLRRAPLPGLAAASAAFVDASSRAAAEPLQAGALIAAATADGAALQRIRVLPIGTFTLRDGRGPFTVADQAHAGAIVAASLAYAGNRDIPFDYDHQLLHAVGAGKGGQAPASGWIKAMTAEADGIWADVEWTPAAAEKLARREYRYISPTFAFDPASGRVSAIRYGSLVNDNAIDELLAVAATGATDIAATGAADLTSDQEITMDYTQIAIALGLEPAASLDDILAAIGAMAVPKQMMVDAASQLGLTGDGVDIAGLVAAATAAGRAAPDPALFVPAATHQAVADRAAALEARRHDEIIAAATAEGKLTPALAGWARGYLGSDEAGFLAWAASAPVVVAPGALTVGQVPAVAGDALIGAASDYIAAQGAKGIVIDAASAVRHVLSTQTA